MPDSTAPRNSFELLELPLDATPAQARQAYRDLISVWHPDRYAHNPRIQQKAEAKIKAINTAYTEVAAWLAGEGKPRMAPPGPNHQSPQSPRPGPGNRKQPPSPAAGQSAAEKDADRRAERFDRWQRTNSLLTRFQRRQTRQQKQREAQARAAQKARTQTESSRTSMKPQPAKPRRTEKTAAPVSERRDTWARTEARLRMLHAAKAQKDAAAPDTQPPMSPQPQKPSWFSYRPDRRLMFYALTLIGTLAAGLIQPYFQPRWITAGVLAPPVLLLGHLVITRTPLKRFFQ